MHLRALKAISLTSKEVAGSGDKSLEGSQSERTDKAVV